MSGLVITRLLLVENAAVTALVPAGRIFAGIARQGTVLPLIALTDVSSTDRNTLNGEATIKVSERVQITVMATSMKELKTLMAAVRRACRNRVGFLGGFQNATCRLDGKGPDFNDAEAQICMQTQDTWVTFNEAA